MKYLPIIAIILSLTSIGYTYQKNRTLGASISTTASSDTLNTFRTNVNASLTSLLSDRVSTTTAFTWTALQSFFANASSTGLSANYLDVGGTATTTLTQAGKLGVASSSPLGRLGIGTSGATSTISTGKFCMVATDPAGRLLYITLSTTRNETFATSTISCL